MTEVVVGREPLTTQGSEGRDLNQVAPCWMTEHELRWAIRDGIAVMYDHLGLGDPNQIPAHEFNEDVGDLSMCVCGIPALTHYLMEEK